MIDQPTSDAKAKRIEEISKALADTGWEVVRMTSDQPKSPEPATLKIRCSCGSPKIVHEAWCGVPEEVARGEYYHIHAKCIDCGNRLFMRVKINSKKEWRDEEVPDPQNRCCVCWEMDQLRSVLASMLNIPNPEDNLYLKGYLNGIQQIAGIIDDVFTVEVTEDAE